MLTTWQKGRELVTREREREEGPLRAFVDELHATIHPAAAPGTARLPQPRQRTTPLAMRANVEHNKSCTRARSSSRSRPSRCRMSRTSNGSSDDLGYRDDGITLVRARLGYMDDPNVPAMIPLIEKAALERPLEPDDLSYFLSTLELAEATTRE